jgi:hypothetical protein
MPAREVEAAVGKPLMAGGATRRYRWPNIWRYGAFELAFDQKDRSLRYIAVIFGADPAETHSLGRVEVDTGGIETHRELEPFRRLLQRQGLKYREETTTDPEARQLRIEDRVLAIFAAGPGGQSKAFLLEKLLSFRVQ